MFFNGKKHTWYHHIKITFLCFKSGKKTLKELSCERILPKFQSIGRPLKREEQRFYKNLPVSKAVEPFKVTVPSTSCWLLGTKLLTREWKFIAITG